MDMAGGIQASQVMDNMEEESKIQVFPTKISLYYTTSDEALKYV